MLAEDLKKGVGKLVDEELARANGDFPLFASNHEAYAVMLEEYDETMTEAEDISVELKSLWIKVKNDERALHCLTYIMGKAGLMACEAIQLAAMAQKAIESERQRAERR